MKVRISALIIDKNKNLHDYSLVKLPEDSIYHPYNMAELGFDLTVYDNCNHILEKIKEASTVDCIITIGDIDVSALNNLSFDFRKRWIHFDEFNPEAMATSIVNCFSYNINRITPDEVKTFSIFTCTFNTPLKMFQRLYKSLRNQTYNNWDWFILDDSTDDKISNYVRTLNDPRIVMIRNVTNHGVIGFNKHLIASICDGDYLVEVDHDDELTTNCLELLHKAFMTFPDTDFVYSYAIELFGNQPVDYGDYFAYGLGEYKNFKVNNTFYKHIATTPQVNALSVRGIYALPNHVRCWKSDFYHKIGGHNEDLSVMDDMDILVRTFLYGKIALVPTVLYIQHEGESLNTNNDRSTQTTAQGKRFGEIQRMNAVLQTKYNKQIHERVLELGGTDPFWIPETEMCNTHIDYNKEELVNFNYILDI
jgi:O-antigen biosynthesis protein